jgi:hypothetical protein
VDIHTDVPLSSGLSDELGEGSEQEMVKHAKFVVATTNSLAKPRATQW